MKRVFPPVKASQVTGRHRAEYSRRTWWQTWFGFKNRVYWVWRDVKNEWECLRKDWFTWRQK
jgi:hypothetical protein